MVERRRVLQSARSSLPSREPIELLLVEDDCEDAELVSEALEEAVDVDFRVHRVDRMSAALSSLQREAFRIVLLDMRLPDSSGFETVMRMRRAFPDGPVVVMTGIDDEKLALKALGVGVQDYLVKGRCDDASLVRSVRRAIERNRVLAELKDSKRQSDYAAMHDPLTGLPNRLLLNDRLRSSLALAERRHEQVAVLFLDLDEFKKVNDRFGHVAGDSVLVEVAERIEAALRRCDTASRIGGDEFVIVLNGIRSEADIEKVANAIVEGVSSPMSIEGVHLEIGASVGWAIYPRDGEDGDALLARADATMYQAKKRGGGLWR